MNLIDRLIQMETERQASLGKQIDALGSGRLHVGERRVGVVGPIDLTQQSLEDARRQLAELEAMLPQLREKANDWH